MDRKTFIIVFDERSFGIHLKGFISPNGTRWVRRYIVDSVLSGCKVWVLRGSSKLYKWRPLTFSNDSAI
jgi:hypothetical protein